MSDDAPPTEYKGLRGTLAIGKEVADLATKVLALVTVTVYLAGYLVSAGRLAEYGVPVTQLLDAQYLIAGLIPALLLWITFIVCYSAYRYVPLTDDSKTLSRVGYFVLILFVVLLIEELLASFSDVAVLRVNSAFDRYVIGPARAILGQATLWYLIGGARTGLFSRLAIFLKGRKGGAGDVYQHVLFLFVLSLVMIYGSYRAGIRLYAEIPQAYGGGSQLLVRLYVDRAKVPAKLLVATPGAETAGLVETVPLQLVFQTSNAFIVRTSGDRQTDAWILDARAVYAIRSTTTESKAP